MENEQPPWYGFVFSNRFWVMIIGAVALYAQTKGWIGEAEMLLVGTISAGFIGIKTIDRISDKKVEAAALSQEG